ncbi:MAG TPA: ATP-binding cassette domain-containing protein, partial [Trueperaceae bacterium]
MNEPLLEVERLDAGYGALQILFDIHLQVAPGENVLVFGPNGAGKSTLMKALVGLVPPQAGSVRLAGRNLAGQSPEDIVRAGLGYVPQVENVFPGMSIEEN